MKTHKYSILRQFTDHPSTVKADFYYYKGLTVLIVGYKPRPLEICPLYTLEDIQYHENHKRIADLLGVGELNRPWEDISIKQIKASKIPFVLRGWYYN